MAITFANTPNSPYTTTTFDPIPLPPITQNTTPADPSSSIWSADCGYYFEYCFIQALRNLSKNNPYLTQNTITPNGHHINAASKFAAAHPSQALLSTKTAIEQAGNITAEYLLRKYDTDIKTALSKQTRSGSSLGDAILYVIQNAVVAQHVILELKWQNNPSNMIKWATITDSALFGDNTFFDFLQRNSTTYWNYKIYRSQWQNLIRYGALVHHLSQQAGYTPNQQLEFLINKGKVLADFKDQNPQSLTKLTVHATQASITIQDTSELAAALSSNNTSSTKPASLAYEYGGITYRNGNEVLAYFGIKSYNLVTEGRGAQRTYTLAKQNPDRDAFKFSTYFTGRAFGPTR